ncbi:hypothetical protein ACIGFK_03120 [Streptomyces sp. NPDC085524]|uniref:hypothetical protein n=1 Tax=Streptomyces sp. NPDC085524 TaxID=3365728 RepID=UPI0037D674EE
MCIGFCHAAHHRRRQAAAYEGVDGRVQRESVASSVLVDADDDYNERGRADFAAIGELLKRAGAQEWTEPGLVEVQDAEFEMRGYSGLHTLRRLAVHLALHGCLPEPLDEARHATDDPLLSAIYKALPGDPPGPFDHLSIIRTARATTSLSTSPLSSSTKGHRAASSAPRCACCRKPVGSPMPSVFPKTSRRKTSVITDALGPVLPMTLNAS